MWCSSQHNLSSASMACEEDPSHIKITRQVTVHPWQRDKDSALFSLFMQNFHGSRSCFIGSVFCFAQQVGLLRKRKEISLLGALCFSVQDESKGLAVPLYFTLLPSAPTPPGQLQPVLLSSNTHFPGQ